MSDTLAIPILRQIIPAGMDYGTSLLVEFEPGSIWYETSLTIAAEALSEGVKTEYHAFRHTPREVERALARHSDLLSGGRVGKSLPYFL